MIVIIQHKINYKSQTEVQNVNLVSIYNVKTYASVTKIITVKYFQKYDI